MSIPDDTHINLYVRLPGDKNGTWIPRSFKVINFDGVSSRLQFYNDKSLMDPIPVPDGFELYIRRTGNRSPSYHDIFFIAHCETYDLKFHGKTVFRLKID